jgi:hypothetical protein
MFWSYYYLGKSPHTHWTESSVVHKFWHRPQTPSNNVFKIYSEFSEMKHRQNTPTMHSLYILCARNQKYVAYLHVLLSRLHNGHTPTSWHKISVLKCITSTPHFLFYSYTWCYLCYLISINIVSLCGWH